VRWRVAEGMGDQRSMDRKSTHSRDASRQNLELPGMPSTHNL
jgi:hypothetical protein